MIKKRNRISIYQAKRNDPVTMRMLADRRTSIILEDFHGVNWHDKTKSFPTFTVFNSPQDFPRKFVVRLFDGTKPTRLITISDTLDDARKTIPTNYLCITRSESDAPAIVETWI